MILALLSLHTLIVSPCVSAHSSGETLNPKDLSLSKALSWLLRHGAISEGLKVNEGGFIPLEQVLEHRLFARRCTAADLRRVVNISKNRFTLQSNPKTGIYEIRANSGHTFKLRILSIPPRNVVSIVRSLINYMESDGADFLQPSALYYILLNSSFRSSQLWTALRNRRDGNNQEAKSPLKLNRGRALPQPGYKGGKLGQSQSSKKENFKNYNIPVGNILLPEDELHFNGRRPEDDKLMKYPELKRALLWILRHGGEKEGLTVKKHGYVPIEQILSHAFFKDRCMREDIITVANNEPHNFKLREGPHSKQLYLRARKEHPIKEEHEDWSFIPDPLYFPKEFIVHGINGSEWDSVAEHGLRVPKGSYLYFSPYIAADSWHTPGVTKFDEIYVYVNVNAAMQDGIQFFQTAEYSVATKGDSNGFIGIQYFRKVIEAKTGKLLYSDGTDDDE